MICHGCQADLSKGDIDMLQVKIKFMQLVIKCPICKYITQVTISPDGRVIVKEDRT